MLYNIEVYKDNRWIVYRRNKAIVSAHSHMTNLINNMGYMADHVRIVDAD